MGCYCAATRPPCTWCESAYECDGCGKIKHPADDGMTTVAYHSQTLPMCDSCVESISNFLGTTTCECGKEKHGFANHSTWCKKWEGKA